MGPWSPRSFEKARRTSRVARRWKRRIEAVAAFGQHLRSRANLVKTFCKEGGCVSMVLAVSGQLEGGGILKG